MGANKKRKTNPDGRNKHGHPYIKIEHWEFDCAAFRDLSMKARAAYLEILRAYNGFNNGEIGMSVRRLASRLGCSINPARSALDELVAHGFIAPTRLGCFAQKSGMATEWRLTGRECNGEKATKDFMSWKPPRNPGIKN